MPGKATTDYGRMCSTLKRNRLRASKPKPAIEEAKAQTAPICPEPTAKQEDKQESFKWEEDNAKKYMFGNATFYSFKRKLVEDAEKAKGENLANRVFDIRPTKQRKPAVKPVKKIEPIKLVKKVNIYDSKDLARSKFTLDNERKRRIRVPYWLLDTHFATEEGGYDWNFEGTESLWDGVVTVNGVERKGDKRNCAGKCNYESCEEQEFRREELEDSQLEDLRWEKFSLEYHHSEDQPEETEKPDPPNWEVNDLQAFDDEDEQELKRRIWTEKDFRDKQKSIMHWLLDADCARSGKGFEIGVKVSAGGEPEREIFEKDEDDDDCFEGMDEEELVPFGVTPAEMSGGWQREKLIKIENEKWAKEQVLWAEGNGAWGAGVENRDGEEMELETEIVDEEEVWNQIKAEEDENLKRKQEELESDMKEWEERSMRRDTWERLGDEEDEDEKVGEGYW